jgi:hypothetical protein
MDIQQAVWVFDTAYQVMRPDEKRAWDAIRKELVEALKPSHNKQSTPLQTCLVCGKPDTNYIAEGVCRHCRR